jgi:hypothetical protein
LYIAIVETESCIDRIDWIGKEAQWCGNLKGLLGYSAFILDQRSCVEIQWIGVVTIVLVESARKRRI